MKKIALTVSYPCSPDDEKDQWRLAKYRAAIEAPGAIMTPLFLDQWETKAAFCAAEFDALVLAGGADLPPSWFGQEPLADANLDLVSQRRPEFEKKVVAAFVERKKPVLGICYGCQFLNVLRGGTLIQDIDLQVAGAIPHADGVIHTVQLARDSQLFEIIGEEEFEVPSFHHQAILQVAPNATISGRASDGVAETVEWGRDDWFLGVQWHPERAPESNATQKLFAALVKACRA